MIFESAQVFYNSDFAKPYDSSESLPLQRRNAAGAWVGSLDSVEKLYRKAKGTLEALPRLTHIEPFKFEQIKKPVWADDVVWLNICFNGGIIGNLALLSKKTALDCGIKNATVMLFELDIDSLKPYRSRTNEFEHLPGYPFNNYDVSLLFDLPVKWEEIETTAAGKKGPDNLLRDVSFVEEYRGRQVPEGKKSVTIRLVIGSLKKTLTSEEIESCANAVVKRLKKVLGAEAR
jgi:phenylalanyl-tRNA synthetase beta chain